MKIRCSILISVFALSLPAIASTCQEKEWESTAQNFLKAESPIGSSIELHREGKVFDFSVHHRSQSGQYSKNGTLEVKEGDDGKCVAVVTQSQVSSQGDDGPATEKNTSADSSLVIEKLAGSWASTCAQTQTNGHQGYVTETYTLTTTQKFSLKRSWFKDSDCKAKRFLTENEQGIFKIGKTNTNNGFNPPRTHEVKFTLQDKDELGLIWVNDDYSELRLSRGFGSSQNTMLSLNQYKKQ